MTDKIVDIRTRMDLVSQKWGKLPEAVRRGYIVAQNMDKEDLQALMDMFGRIILFDVEQGLKGEETEFLFDAIDSLYEKWEQEKEAQVKTCFFCDEETDVGVCLRCLMKKCGGADDLLKNRGLPEKR